MAPTPKNIAAAGRLIHLAVLLFGLSRCDAIQTSQSPIQSKHSSRPWLVFPDIPETDSARPVLQAGTRQKRLAQECTTLLEYFRLRWWCHDV
ncbi:hypothetical protein DPV78_002048 [Talaromyces pinophilus]|nr:hypothetical protein DPV78_002048 [Talaromyces pinophilus]